MGIGGEHTVTYGLIKGMLDAGERDFGVVQIDAHADLRDRYEDNPYSHASVMKRIVDEGIPLLQLGIRAICEEEMQTRKEFGIAHYDAEALVPTNVSSVQLPEGFPKRIFFTVDVAVRFAAFFSFGVRRAFFFVSLVLLFSLLIIISPF